MGTNDMAASSMILGNHLSPYSSPVFTQRPLKQSNIVKSSPLIDPVLLVSTDSFDSFHDRPTSPSISSEYSSAISSKATPLILRMKSDDNYFIESIERGSVDECLTYLLDMHLIEREILPCRLSSYLSSAASSDERSSNYAPAYCYTVPLHIADQVYKLIPVRERAEQV
jgi:hypothetical protein